MIEDTTAYEYRLAPYSSYIVQVRPTRPPTGFRAMGWKVYHFADSPADAERILAMLVSDQAEADTVRP